MGALIDITERWKFALSGTYLEFPLGDKSGEWRIAAQQRYTLHRNVALGLDLNRRSGTQEYLMNLFVYF
jgi:hypothetical protein